MLSNGVFMTDAANWVLQDDAGSDRIASIALLAIGSGCCWFGYQRLGVQDDARYLLGIGGFFLLLWLIGLIWQAKSRIEINIRRRELRFYSSSRFSSQVKTYRFSDLERVDYKVFKVPEEQDTACVDLVLRSGRRLSVPGIHLHNAAAVAQKLADKTGVPLVISGSDTGKLWGR
jgi:hypothetical protein